MVWPGLGNPRFRVRPGGRRCWQWTRALRRRNVLLGRRLAAQSIAKWDAVQWQSLQGGGVGLPGEGASVRDLYVHDDGGGPALYMAGDFHEVSGTVVEKIGKFQNGFWSSIGGINNPVFALAVWDEGTGPALFAAGFFNDAGGTQVSNIVAWDGVNWRGLGVGLDHHQAMLHSFDTGAGAALISRQNSAVVNGYAYLSKWNTAPGCAPQTYCTGTISFSGCAPTIAASWSASLSPPGAFSIVASQLEAQRFGLQFFGTSGSELVPIAGGVLCVQAPTYRLAVQNSGGAAAFDGSIVTTPAELLAHPSGSALVVAEQQINQQTWFRDPIAPSGVALTNAVQYVVVA